MSTAITQKSSSGSSMIDRIERLGDKVNHPFYLFIFI